MKHKIKELFNRVKTDKVFAEYLKVIFYLALIWGGFECALYCINQSNTPLNLVGLFIGLITVYYLIKLVKRVIKKLN